MRLFSPAKINLFLRILGKRADGYHDIASLLQTIDIGDFLTFHLAKEDTFTCSNPNLLCNKSNLVMKALQLFRRKTSLQFSVQIHLEKNIPMEAGLGGGSSNAATTLYALNVLHNHPFSENELQILSADIGSDVPFFFSSGTAYCLGRGEKVRPVPLINMLPLMIIKPATGLSTPAVYKALQLDLCSKENPEKILEDFLSNKPHFINDLEEPALRLCPELQNIKNTYSATMTGSGSAFFTQNIEDSRLAHVGQLCTSIHRAPLEWYI